jgi:twinkle protein
MGKIIGDEPCPKCREKGRDSTGNHLIVFEDGNKYCNRCGYYEHKGGVPERPIRKEELFTYSPTYKNELSLAIISRLSYKLSKERKITQATYAHFGVKSECSEATGEPVAYYYPITKEGETTGYKKRLLPKSFTSIGDGNGKIELFGQAVCEAGGKRLLITGGEEDCVAAHQMLATYNPVVTSLPKGESCASVADNLDFILSFKEVIIATDMDEAGRKAASQIVDIIGYEKARILTISEKDASDMLVKGKEKEFVSSYFSAKPYLPADIVSGSIGIEALQEPLKDGIEIKCLPKLMEKLHGFRQGEMTIILAPPGVGKTTVCKQIGYDLLSADKSILHVFLEEDIRKTQQSYIALDNRVSLPKLRQDPNLLSKDQWEASEKKLLTQEKTLWVNHFGSISPDELMKDIRYANARGYKFVILDHISMVFSGLQTSNERKEIDLLLTELAAFTKQASIHPIVVSHVRRINKPAPKDSKGNIQYPYWDTVATDAARGSGAFEQLAWNIIAIEPEILESGERGRVRLSLLKNREWGMLGKCDEVRMDSNTGHLVKAEDPEFGF